jgi:PleD family two-component response regulator
VNRGDTLIVAADDRFATLAQDAVAARGGTALRARGVAEAREVLEQGRRRLVIVAAERVNAACALAAWIRERQAAGLLVSFGAAEKADVLIAAGFDDAAPTPPHAAPTTRIVARLVRCATMQLALRARDAALHRFSVETRDVAPAFLSQPRVLLCGDAGLAAALSPSMSCDAVAATDAHAALFRSSYDAILLASAPDTALRLCRSLRRSASLYATPILLVGDVEPEAAFVAGVTDIVPRGWLVEEVGQHAASVQRLGALRARLVAGLRRPLPAALVCAETGLAAPNVARELLRTLSLATGEADAPMSLARVTLHSKNGPDVLAQLGRVFRDALRVEDDVLCLHDGELMLALPDTPDAGARIAAARLEAYLRRSGVELTDGRRVTISASITVVERRHDEDVADLIDRLRGGDKVIAAA